MPSGLFRASQRNQSDTTDFRRSYGRSSHAISHLKLETVSEYTTLPDVTLKNYERGPVAKVPVEPLGYLLSGLVGAIAEICQQESIRFVARRHINEQYRF